MSKMVDILTDAFSMLENGKTALIKVKEKLAELDEVKVKVYRETEDVKLPTYAHDDDACMDVYVHDIEIKDDGRIVYHTGLHFKLPEDYEMEIRPRSSLTKSTSIMQNAPGTLDEGYTGELMVVHRRINGNDTPEFNVGDKVAQILVRRRERIKFEEVDIIEDLGETERGDGGFGSTDIKKEESPKTDVEKEEKPNKETWCDVYNGGRKIDTSNVIIYDDVAEYYNKRLDFFEDLFGYKGEHLWWMKEWILNAIGQKRDDMDNDDRFTLHNLDEAFAYVEKWHEKRFPE